MEKPSSPPKDHVPPGEHIAQSLCTATAQPTRPEQASLNVVPSESSMVREGRTTFVVRDVEKQKTSNETCCWWKSCRLRNLLEMDDETAYVYREAKVCGLSYVCISTWCYGLIFATAASASIIVIGFLDERNVKYQIIGIALTAIFGCALPTFFVLWIALKIREANLRRSYRAHQNRQLVYVAEVATFLNTHRGTKETRDNVENNSKEMQYCQTLDGSFKDTVRGDVSLTIEADVPDTTYLIRD